MRMHDINIEGDRDWTEATALTAPALLGAAAGLILSEVMNDNARRGIAIGLAALGLAALMPLAVGGVVNRVNGPHSKRGVRRRIGAIRDSGASVDDELMEAGVI